jgi:SAM-dependent methyltransferase
VLETGEELVTETLKEHWDFVYSSKPIAKLGWYEPQPTPSLELIRRCVLGFHDPILDVGSGASTLIPALLEEGYENITALDISSVALQKAQAELGAEKAARVRWLVEDVTQPSGSFDLSNIVLWHDRAVFHFLTTEHQRRNYLATLAKVLRLGGYVILAAFEIGGASKCSGLDVQNYDVESLVQFLGSEFSLMESRSHTYRMPSGDLRPYVYALFQRKTFSSLSLKDVLPHNSSPSSE